VRGAVNGPHSLHWQFSMVENLHFQSPVAQGMKYGTRQLHNAHPYVTIDVLHQSLTTFSQP